MKTKISLLIFFVSLLISPMCHSNNYQSAYNALNDPDHDYIPFIEEGKEWVYTLYWRDPVTEWQRHRVWKYIFDGTEEKYGKLYHRLVNTKYYIGGYGDGDDHQHLEPQEPLGVVALLREEDKRVFLLVENESYFIFDPQCESVYPLCFEYFADKFDKYSSKKQTIPGEEILIYDFNLEEGDTIWTMHTVDSVLDYFNPKYEDILGPSTCLGAEKIFENINGAPTSEFRNLLRIRNGVQHFICGNLLDNPDNKDNYELLRKTTDYILEGVGNIFTGSILAPGAQIISIPSTTYGISNLIFKEFIDYNRNIKIINATNYVRFDTPGNPKIENLSDINIIQTSPATNYQECLYNLYGLPIQYPQKGQIYIDGQRRKIIIR